jgi:hypothetical protein
MAWRKHNRQISKQQFSDSTTIDGSRVEDAMQDVEDHVNAVPGGDIQQRFMQTQVVAGYSPHAEAWVDGTDLVGGALVINQNVFGLAAQASTALTGSMFPFLPVYNSAANLSQAPAVTPDAFTNPHRSKGYRVPGIDIEPSSGSGFEQQGSVAPLTTSLYDVTGQFSWEMSWSFRKPIVVAKVTVCMMTDDIANADIGAPVKARMPYRNDYAFDNPPVGNNPPYAAGSASEDVLLQLTVDDLFLPEDRALTSVEVTRHKFEVKKENVTTLPWAHWDTADDMFPPLYPGGHPMGCVINVDCDVPVPEDSRVRFTFMVPKYDIQGDQSPAPAGWPVHGGWRGVPWFRQYYTVCLTLLEEVG